MATKSIAHSEPNVHSGGWVVIGASAPTSDQVRPSARTITGALTWAGVDEHQLRAIAEHEVLWTLPDVEAERMMQVEIALERARLGLRATERAGHLHAGFYRQGAGDLPDECIARARAAARRAGVDVASRIVSFRPELDEERGEDEREDDQILTWAAQLVGHIATEMGWPAHLVRSLERATAMDELATAGPEADAGAGTPGLFSRQQLMWLMHQHERWDGSGHPLGLRASQISEGGLIIAAARRYAHSTRGWPARSTPDVALGECVQLAGSALSPYVVSALGRAIARRHAMR